MTNQPIKIEKIRFENVCYSHEGHDATLNQADFEFPTHEVVWIKSPEGAGKSTLLQILAGLQIPQHGGYFLNNENVVEMSFEEFLPYRLQIGYSFDYGGLINNRSIQDNLMLPLVYHKMMSYPEAHEKAKNLIERFEIQKFKDERPAHIPGRVRKLTCLLRAVIHRPQILLMDDPSIGLGQETTHNFVDLINEMKKEGSLNHVFICSYDEKFMNLFTYKTVTLDQGLLYLQSADPEKKVVNI